METIEVQESDLILEVRGGDPPALRLSDSVEGSAVAIQPADFRALRNALAEATGLAAEAVAGGHSGE
jgi:hypothetical protein